MYAFFLLQMAKKWRSSPTKGPSLLQVPKCARHSATAMLHNDHSSTDHLLVNHSLPSTEFSSILLLTEKINTLVNVTNEKICTTLEAKQSLPNTGTTSISQSNNSLGPPTLQ